MMSCSSSVPAKSLLPTPFRRFNSSRRDPILDADQKTPKDKVDAPKPVHHPDLNGVVNSPLDVFNALQAAERALADEKHKKKVN